MRIFVGWSGRRSRQIAEALRGWLPQVLQAADPWTSSVDLAAGPKWVRQIEYELRETRAGIVCLTPENLQAPWLLVGTGALWARGSVIIPYLLDFAPTELTGPLARFQAVQAGREGTWQLVQTLNRMLDERSVSPQVLTEAFDRAWPTLESRVEGALETRPTAISKPPKKPKSRKIIHSARNLLEEILRQVSAPAQHKVPEGLNRSGDGFVFIVHGHDHGTKEAVARFLQTVGVKAVILHEQPNEGRAVIEKFEANSGASYAVVLLTADDRGGPQSVPYKKQQSRARQNVILELGFFLSKLGRNRVTVLHEAGVEFPSDYSGVLPIALDGLGAWRFLLARELKAAGFDVDVNKLF